jgi:periplasmic divalent cation tolerance protein
MVSQPNVCEIIITAPDESWLRRLGHDLVTEGWCAAAHTVAGVTTSYRWQGRIYDTVEAKTTLHTRLSLADQIVRRVTLAHPYDVPDVIVTPILAGNRDYLQWIADQSDRT